MQLQQHHRQGGFTLIELMITVAIVAILASVAVPSYLESVRRGNRAEAIATLLEASNWLQRGYTVNNTYVGATTSDAAGMPAWASRPNPAAQNTTSR